ncbi:MAG: hypothetical protein HKP14_07230 [Bacteroidia bacterium]|nr:hypothetical protein [Bacteroidia bacterium]
MKKITKLGFLALTGLILFATSCKKDPSAKIHNTWKLENFESAEADSVAVAEIINAGLNYTFTKKGTYNYSGAKTGSGTYEINEAGTSMTTTEDGKTDMYQVMLTENNLQLTRGKEIMKFTANK